MHPAFLKSLSWLLFSLLKYIYNLVYSFIICCSSKRHILSPMMTLSITGCYFHIVSLIVIDVQVDK